MVDTSTVAVLKHITDHALADCTAWSGGACMVVWCVEAAGLFITGFHVDAWERHTLVGGAVAAVTTVE